MVERGVCTFDEKVANVEAVTANGGYAGTIIFNRTASDDGSPRRFNRVYARASHSEGQQP